MMYEVFMVIVIAIGTMQAMHICCMPSVSPTL